MTREELILQKLRTEIRKNRLFQLINEIKTNILEIPTREDYFITKEIQNDLHLKINNNISSRDSNEPNNNKIKIKLSGSNHKIYNSLESPFNNFLQKKPFHFLKLFIENFDESAITEEKFNQFINNDIIDKSKTIEENNKLILQAKNIFNLLGAFAEYTAPLEEEVLDYKETFYSNTYWTVTATSRILNVSRKTLYNWKEEFNFTNENGKVDLNKLLIFFKKSKPNYYTLLLDELVNTKSN